MDKKLLNNLNQVAKTLRDDSLYIVKDGEIISVVTKDLFEKQTQGKFRIIIKNAKYDELLYDLDKCLISGKELYGLFKEVKELDVLENDNTEIVIGNAQQHIKLKRHSKMKKQIIQKYKSFPKTSYENDSYDITELATNMSDNNVVEEYCVSVNDNMMTIRLSKKLLRGYKSGDNVTLSVSPTNSNSILFILKIVVDKGDFAIENYYVIINF